MSTIRISGKQYPVEIRNGERFVNGMTVDEFMKTLSFDELLDLAILGKKYGKGLDSKSPQAVLMAIEKVKQKN